jgi:peptide/nickel transport system permease protein
MSIDGQSLKSSERGTNTGNVLSGYAPLESSRSELRRILHDLISNRGAMVGLIITCLLILIAVTASVIAPFSPAEQNISSALQSPSTHHLMGTDEFGRDILSRIFYGARISLRMGVLVVLSSALVGVTAGLCAAYYGGWLDTLTLRLVDALLAFPDILLAMVVLAILGPSIASLTIGIAVARVPAFVRLARATMITERARVYVEAERTIGARNSRIIFRHILPNAAPPLIVLASLTIGSAILTGAALSFLGLGAQPPTPEWGAMLISSRLYMQRAPWVTLFPGGAIMLAVFAFNMVGDGLRDALDPSLRRR